MPESTNNLLPRIAKGDSAAVELCLEQYGGLVWSLARRMSPTREEAEDAVQDIFIEIWKNADRFDAGIASEVTFVAVIARRRLIDRRRKAGRRPNEDALVEEAARDEMLVQVASQAAMGEEAALAREVIGELSEDQQRVLQLSIFHGQSHEKIARSTGLPLGTVKTHARRGLLRVRDLLRQRGASNGSGVKR